MFDKLRSAGTPAEAAQAVLEWVRSPWTLVWAREVASRGIPDMLRDGPRSVDALAAKADAHAPTLYRVLRALSSVGFFEELNGRRFALTATGRLLCAGDDALSQRDGLLLTGLPFYRKLVERVPDVLTSGISAFELGHGEPLFRHVQTNREIAAAVDAAMTCLTNAYLHSILAAYRFDDVGTLVDLGCGHGRFVFSLLRTAPSIRKATLLDLPHVVAAAKQAASAAGVSDRCEFVGASYFAPGAIPAGADVYVLKHNCHDHPDDDVVRLLSNVRGALRTGGRALLIDGVLPPPNAYSVAVGMDLAALALLPAAAKERTHAEWLELVAAAGLAVRRTVATDSDLSIIELSSEHTLARSVRS